MLIQLGERISLDTKARVTIGSFDRGGKSRIPTESEDHDYNRILDEVETALNYAKNMKWNGKNPVVKLVTQTYETGVKLTKQAMNEIENKVQRLTNSNDQKFPNLGKWFIDICYGVT